MDRAARQADRMKMELSLDDVQYKVVKAINEDFADRQLTLRGESTLSKQEIQKKAWTLRDEKNATLAKVLTEDQKSKWKSYPQVRLRDTRPGWRSTEVSTPSECKKVYRLATSRLPKSNPSTKNLETGFVR